MKLDSENVVSFGDIQKRRQEKQIYHRWTEFFQAQAHEELLQALVYEHENNFPLRRSSEPLDQLKHKAMIAVLHERAQTEFLKTLLSEIK